MEEEPEIIEIGEENRGKDKILGISECTDRVILHYEKAGQARDTEIPRAYVDYVKKLIDSMDYGTNFHSKYIYNRCIEKFNIESNIVKQKLNFIEQILKERKLQPSIIDSIMKELQQSKDFMLMDFQELIGTRTIESSEYFKIYGCIKYHEAKNRLSYNKRGYFMRIE